MCKLQFRLFGRASKEGIPSAYFVKVFANSKYCSMLDNLDYFDFYVTVSEDAIFEFVKTNTKMRRGTIYPSFVMEWIGYLLREWAYRYQMRTKAILKKVKLKDFADVYYPYHSLDVQKAIQLIAEEHEIDLSLSPEERFYAILKKVYSFIE